MERENGGVNGGGAAAVVVVVVSGEAQKKGEGVGEMGGRSGRR